MDVIINIGDSVKLKNDPQFMYVEDIHEETAICTWLYKGDKKRGQFSLQMLVKIDPESTAPKVIQSRPSMVDDMRGKYLPEKR